MSVLINLEESIDYIIVATIGVPAGETGDLQYSTSSVTTSALTTAAATVTSFRTLLRAIATRPTDVLFFHTFTLPNT